MCFGESFSDSLRPGELSFLRRSAAERMPEYEVATHDNGQIAWAVLEPDDRATLPRFTICRVDPCILVMVEEAEERRFVSAASLDGAIVIARRAVHEAAALRNVHRRTASGSSSAIRRSATSPAPLYRARRRGRDLA